MSGEPERGASPVCLGWKRFVVPRRGLAVGGLALALSERVALGVSSCLGAFLLRDARLAALLFLLAFELGAPLALTLRERLG
jgi:hypothetical protein